MTLRGFAFHGASVARPRVVVRELDFARREAPPARVVRGSARVECAQNYVLTHGAVFRGRRRSDPPRAPLRGLSRASRWSSGRAEGGR
jgi:hypothetical protein